jgi:hypothetical protein
MVRIGAIFIALCMVLIAASLGAVLFLRSSGLAQLVRDRQRAHVMHA